MKLQQQWEPKERVVRCFEIKHGRGWGRCRSSAGAAAGAAEVSERLCDSVSVLSVVLYSTLLVVSMVVVLCVLCFARFSPLSLCQHVTIIIGVKPRDPVVKCGRNLRCGVSNATER